MEISIVIPTYRRPDRIRRAVESALHQTVAEKEVIVVDDNGKGTDSQKDTQFALQDLIDSKAITYLVNSVNRRGSYSRNRGLSIARGRYITFLDDDDEFHPDKLKKQISRLDELGEEYSCCFVGYHKIVQNGTVYTSDEHEEGYVYPLVLAKAIYNGSGSNLVVRTAVANEIGGYDETFRKRQDLEFMARLLKRYKLALVDEDLMTIHYEIRDNGENYEQLSDADDHYLDVFQQEIDALPEKTAKAINQTIALERWRDSIGSEHQRKAFRYLKEAGVTPWLFFRYLCYVADRVIRKKSYGFKLVKTTYQ